jgi:hypothetical protein
VPWWLSAVAAGIVLVTAVRVCGELQRLQQHLRALRIAHASLGPRDGASVVRFESGDAWSYALPGTPGRPSRVLVSSGLLSALDDEELALALAHERSHLANHHARFQWAGRSAVAASPILRPVAEQLDLALERWADEDAAAGGDRAAMASALAKAALASAGRNGRPPKGMPLSLLAMHTNGVHHRIDALLDEQPVEGWVAWLSTCAALAAAGCLAWAMHDTERFFEALRLIRSP